ncbi:ABC transporter permease subunit (plasmid) [Paenarthrobacter sp. OM7]|uniref:ABC transporter permease n=1 Tax=Paenarthrobacter sp. OM7 TaxID=3041264 RepID=UPI002468C044|nr:ABC transporter permease subunit [Paenarthrobacter sp. OM7]WGM22920.1 ABC transporter permease subunit [Paenarthrobacter sp. OM7]
MSLTTGRHDGAGKSDGQRRPTDIEAPLVVKKVAKRRRGTPKWAVPVAIALTLALYWVVSLSFDAYIFPPLTDVLEQVWKILVGQPQNIAVTLLRYGAALFLAIIAGWALGLLMGAYRRIFGPLMGAFTSIIQAVPAISWILLAVLWMSSVEVRIGFITFMISVPFFIIAVYEGIRDMDKDVLEAVEQFRPSKFQTLRILLLPQSLVSLMTAMRSTAAMTLKIMVLAELLGANNGIGRSMGTAQANFQIDVVFAWTVILIAANFAVIKLIDLLERALLRWRTEAVVR